MPEGILLDRLSGLGLAGAASVARLWSDLATSVRRQIVALLVDMAEADVEIDFGAVFRIALEDDDAEVHHT